MVFEFLNGPRHPLTPPSPPAGGEGEEKEVAVDPPVITRLMIQRPLGCQACRRQGSHDPIPRLLAGGRFGSLKAAFPGQRLRRTCHDAPFLVDAHGVVVQV